jgi:molybdate transport system ATP-binding protein
VVALERAMTAALSVTLRKEFRTRHAATFALDVALEIPPGFTILFGPSGAGKSTLLDCIAGLVQPDAGRIAAGACVLFNAQPNVNLAPQKRQIAYVFQSLALFPHMTVEENVAYGLADRPSAERRERVREILESFRAGHIAARRPGEISGGERQRTALARSLVTAPRVVLLDEPLTALDEELKAGIVEDLRRWNAARQLAILYVTHSREEARALGDRMIALDAGRNVAQGAPGEVLGELSLRGAAARVRS